MRPLALVFLVLVVVVLFIDYVFLPKSARNAWKIMVFTFSFCLLCIFFPQYLDTFSMAVFRVPRGADLLIYFFLSFLIRDYFVSRHHMNEMSKQILRFTREDAKSNYLQLRPVKSE